MSVDIENPAHLEAYLRHAGHIKPNEQIKVSVLQGGVSNKTMLVHMNSATWVLKQALEKLRVKVDWFSDPVRIHREALGLRHLSTIIPGCIPEFMFEDFENHILGMAAIPEPYQNWKSKLLARNLHEHHVAQFANILANIHSQSYQNSRTLAEVFSDTGFFESLRLEPYYLFAATQVPQARQFLHALVQETRLQKHSLVHGDYSPKNILIFQDKLILLDYEVIHWGDPAFDVGFALTHLLSKAHYLRSESFLEAAGLFWQSYFHQDYGNHFECRCVQHTLGCLLARVAGRSPLEYLTEVQKNHQRDITLSLLETRTIHQLIKGFQKGLKEK
jgi:fructosamine-3-kinase